MVPRGSDSFGSGAMGVLYFPRNLLKGFGRILGRKERSSDKLELV